MRAGWPGWEGLTGHELIRALVREGALPSSHLLERVSEHVAMAGFDPVRLQRIDRQLVGLEWQERTLGRGDRLPVAVAHYLKHVTRRREWPAGTTLDEYLETARTVVRAPDAGVSVSAVAGGRRLRLVARVLETRPHAASDWVVVEYSVDEGHWQTVFRLWRGAEQLDRGSLGEGVRWWRGYR